MKAQIKQQIAARLTQLTQRYADFNGTQIVSVFGGPHVTDFTDTAEFNKVVLPEDVVVMRHYANVIRTQYAAYQRKPSCYGTWLDNNRDKFLKSAISQEMGL